MCQLSTDGELYGDEKDESESDGSETDDDYDLYGDDGESCVLHQSRCKSSSKKETKHGSNHGNYRRRLI